MRLCVFRGDATIGVRFLASTIVLALGQVVVERFRGLVFVEGARCKVSCVLLHRWSV